MKPERLAWIRFELRSHLLTPLGLGPDYEIMTIAEELLAEVDRLSAIIAELDKPKETP
mgnify:CR=1 FL=1